MGVTSASKRRRVEEGMHGRVQPKKRFRKQKVYHSDSEDEDQDAAGGVRLPKAVTTAPAQQQQQQQQQTPLQPGRTTRAARRQDKKHKDGQPTETTSGASSDASSSSAGTTGPSKASKKQNSKSLVAASDSEDEGDEEEEEEEESGDDDDDDVAELDDDELDLDGDDDLDADSEGDADDDDDDESSTRQRQRAVPKRSDPTAFSTSISKILSTKIPTSARADPLLSRSQSAAQLTADISDEKLEARARAKLRAQKKEEMEKGHVVDVLGIERGEAGETADLEKRLRKIAQRGVVKLFNAVRAAQVRGEELAREERQKRTTVGMDERKKIVNEVSKQGFLELINGKGNKKLSIEEA
ncbi:hypothetical protein KEM52_000332 [Ascosphaera acerosa]|nr:hypothetical protein KEM52_000332 [Ascosphaera acerosa]